MDDLEKLTMAQQQMISRVMSDMGRRGGLARAKAMTAEERRQSAMKASRVAARARTRRAKERKRKAAKS